MQDQSAARLAHFGSFEADFRERTLTKMGSRIRLQEQPLRILELLVERPGELVTREEIRQKVWPQDVFVDFDAALNTAVRKLRDALSDSAENPRFLETVPRRGYRFLAPVAWPAEPSHAPARSGFRLHRYLAVAAALVAAGLTISAIWHSRGPGSRLTADDKIVLADFANNTDDKVFDDTLKTALSLSLRQSPFFKVLPQGEVDGILQRMIRPAGTKLTPELARELCQRAGGKAYLAGSIGKLGSKYVLELKAVNCENGDVLAQDQMLAASKENVLDTLGDAASRLRNDLGESLASVRKFDVPLAHATTPSLEALKEYSVGLKVFDQKGTSVALPYFQRAIDLDPNFAIGYDELGLEYYNLSERGRASEYFRKAFQLRDTGSEWEKLAIAADYYLNATGELDKAAYTYEQWIERYPLSDEPYSSLGVVYATQGQYEKATEATRQGLRLAPSLGSYGNLASYALASQHFDEARQIIHEAQARKMDAFEFHTVLYALAFFGADSAAMGEEQRWFAGNPEESFGLTLASDTEAYHGSIGKAQTLSEQAADSAVRVDNKESGAIWLANAALREAAYGRAPEARRTAAEALKLAPASAGAEAEVALAFAMTGDTSTAVPLLQDLRKSFPLDTQIQSLWLPAIQMQLALDKKNLTYILNAPETVSPVEFGTILFVANISCLYPVYVRGEAYLSAGDGRAAAAEFQKILDHSGIVWNCWTGALAHLGLARAEALQAKTSQGADADAARAKARVAYEGFFTLWKDADPEIPVLKQANAEYAKL